MKRMGHLSSTFKSSLKCILFGRSLYLLSIFCSFIPSIKSENIEPDSTPSNPSVGTPVSDNKRKKNISFPLESDEDDE